MSTGIGLSATTSSNSTNHFSPPPPPNQTSVIQSTKSYQNGTGNGSSSSFIGSGNGNGSGSGNTNNGIVLFGNGDRSNGNSSDTPSNSILHAKEKKLCTSADGGRHCMAEFGSRSGNGDMSMETSVAITKTTITTTATSTDISSNMDSNMDTSSTTASILHATNLNHSITTTSSTVINTDNGFRNQK